MYVALLDLLLRSDAATQGTHTRTYVIKQTLRERGQAAQKITCQQDRITRTAGVPAPCSPATQAASCHAITATTSPARA